MFAREVTPFNFVSGMTKARFGRMRMVEITMMLSGSGLRKVMQILYEDALFKVSPISTTQIKKSLERFIDPGSNGRSEIYEITFDQVKHLHDLASEFHDLEIYHAKASNNHYALVQSSDKSSRDTKLFYLKYHGSDNIPGDDTTGA